MSSSLHDGPSDWLDLIESAIDTSRRVGYDAGDRVHLDVDSKEVLFVRHGRVRSGASRGTGR